MTTSHPVNAVHWIVDEFDYDDEKYPLVTLACGVNLEKISRFARGAWNWRQTLTAWDRQKVTCPACKASWEYIEEEIDAQIRKAISIEAKPQTTKT